MNAKLLSLGVVIGLTAGSLPAANIAWVSFHPADGTPSTAAFNAGFTNAPDVGYTALLAANGHTVTRFVTADNLNNNPDLIAAINTNDVAILSRSVPSGHYEVVAETAAWNVAVNIPVISMSGYINRANRLGFHTGNDIPDANVATQYLKVNFPAHPIFTGVSLDGNNVMVNPYSQRVTYTNSITGVELLQVGLSVVTNAIRAGGTILATLGTQGEGAATNGMIIGEFPAGTTLQRGDILSAKRLVFLSGSREGGGLTSEGSGIFDLQADGATLFLNAVNYMIPPPTPPQITSNPIGATNLVAGDAWTLTAGVSGSNPRFFQWYKGGVEVPGATSPALAFPSLVNPTDAGEYFLIASNSFGSATSGVARLEFLAFAPTSITNGMIAYWPLDAVTGTKTVDQVSSYDMTLVNLSGANIVPGKWGNGFQFNGTNSHMERLHATNDALPVYQHPNFTVSFWVNAAGQTDKRVYAEGSLTDNDPMFSLGTHNTGADAAIDVYIRNDTGGTSGDHRHGIIQLLDGVWHNVVYVQRDVGNGSMRAQIWVDGALDTIVINPVRPLTANTTAFGALRRAAASAWFNGAMDEVATWNRALSPEEIGILQITQITNPPTRIQPLAINSFKADLPAVVTGGSTTLRWDVSKDVTQVTLSGFGDVTAQTSVGIGSQVISPAQSTNYVLTVIRGVDGLSSTTSVAVVTGVNPGWTLLDNFDQAQVGNLSASGYWNDTSGTAGQVVNVYGSKALRSTNTGVAFLNLRNLSVVEGQACTLFFRMIAGDSNAAGVTNILGLTDKSQRNFADAFANIGSVLYVAPFTNSGVGVDTNGWYLGARNFPGGDIDYFGNNPSQAQAALDFTTVYNIWVDITNAPLGEFLNDVFSVYVQKEGGGPRAVLFQDYFSDRDLFAVDPVLGGILPNLDKLVVMGNGATVSAIFDDFYLSTAGYNSTVPKPSSFTFQPGPLNISWSGNQIQIAWPDGILQSSTNATGPYFDVPGNPTSPLLVNPTGERVFYRSRQ